MKLSRDAWLGIGILLALVIVTSAAAIRQSSRKQMPYLSTSSAPDGTLAFKLWLDELGYNTISTSSFDPQPGTKTIFIIQPFVPITAPEWKSLDAWIEKGGTLILAGDKYYANDAMLHFNFSIAYLASHAAEISSASPLLKSPPLVTNPALPTDVGLSTERSDYTTLMTANGAPVIVSLEQGNGRVILSVLPNAFTNLALKKDENASLILNLLALSRTQKGNVWIDEWHHGFQSGEIVGPWEWLKRTPGGHAILFVVFALFVALILQGQAFGRPVPLRHEIKRRAPMEHITAVANLNRKAGHRTEVAKQYHDRLKRHLGQRYRLTPSIPDEEYVRSLAGYNSSIDKNELLRLLKQLSKKNISEAELLKLSAEASEWMSE